MERLRPSYDVGILTDGPLVRSLEEKAAEVLGVAHVVAVASCTAGLMLCVQALEVEGTVLLPSFTFSASAHAVAWNGLRPAFADCDPCTFQVDVDDLAGRIDGAGAVMATHVFGAPCEVERLQAMAQAAGIPILFDAAHAFGATRRGRSVGGFGACEVFSLTPTKIVVGGEGGLVTTDDAGLADAVRMGRNYGNPGNYDTRFAGLNARMSEFHAALALESLLDLDPHLERRRWLARRYEAALQCLPGIAWQAIDPADQSTYKDFTITVDEAAFGASRHTVVRALEAEGVDTRSYFCPPVHRHQAYYHLPAVHLPVTDRVAARVINLPIYPDLPDHAPAVIAETLMALHAHAEEALDAVRR